MNITLRIKDEEKTFQADFIPAVVYRKYLEIRKTIDLTSVEGFDEVVALLVSAYGKQFTIDEFWNGIDARHLDATILDFISEMTGTKKGEKKGK